MVFFNLVHVTRFYLLHLVFILTIVFFNFIFKDGELIFGFLFCVVPQLMTLFMKIRDDMGEASLSWECLFKVN